MAEIQLVRQPGIETTDAEREAAMRVLLGHVDGLGERNQKSWRRFWRRLLALTPGEMVQVITHQARLSWYHKKHMALEQSLFESQERFPEFERFRDWLKVGAGHVDWLPTANGPIPLPKSISYARMEQGEMEVFHGAVVDFIRTDYAGRALWPHLRLTARIEMVEGILGGFGE